MTVPVFAGGVAEPLFFATDFNGTDQAITFSNSSLSNSSTGILSFWFRIDTLPVNDRGLWDDGSSSGYFQLALKGANSRIGFSLRGSTLTDRYIYFSANNSYNTAGVWRHFLASWNTNASSGARTVYIYEDDSDNTGSGSITDVGNAFNVNYNNGGSGNSQLGRIATSFASSFPGCMSEVYFAPGQFLDFSVEANRRKFINASGKQVFLGTDGSLPTGSQPYLFLPNNAATFNINAGTGPDGSIINGPLTECSTRP